MNIHSKHFFKFLQIRSYISKTQNSLSLPTLTSFEEIAVNHNSKRGRISRFYEIVMDSSQASSENKRLAWCEDLNDEITVEDWQKVCLNAQRQSINTRFKLLQYKWIMRLYITPILLNKFNPCIPDLCSKCGTKGTLFHCLWDCPIIQAFWIEVLDILSYVTGVRLTVCPKLCILGIFSANCKLSNADKKMTVFCLLQAKHTIAKLWKSVNRPSLQIWLEGLLHSLALEKLTLTIKGKFSTFEKIWRSFMEFLEGEKSAEACLP